MLRLLVYCCELAPIDKGCSLAVGGKLRMRTVTKGLAKRPVAAWVSARNVGSAEGVPNTSLRI